MRVWWLFLLMMLMSPVARAGACQCDDYEFTRMVEKLEKLSHQVEAADSQFFDEGQKLLAETGQFLPDLQASLRKGRERWTFNAATAVADVTASMAMAGLGFGLDQAAGTIEGVGEISLAAVDHAYSLGKGHAGSHGANRMLERRKRAIRKRLKRMRRLEEAYVSGLDRMMEIAKRMRACSRCQASLPRLPRNPSIDPKDTSFFQQIRSQAGGQQPPCDTCADIQALFDYIGGMRGIFSAKKILLKESISNQKSLVKNYLLGLKLVGRAKWDETLAGRVGDLATSGLALMSGGIGGIVKVVGSKIVDYFQEQKVAPGMQSLMDSIRQMEKFQMRMEGLLAQGGAWDQTGHALKQHLWRLIRYRYGKCGVCRRPDGREQARKHGIRMPEKKSASRIREGVPRGGEKASLPHLGEGVSGGAPGSTTAAPSTGGKPVPSGGQCIPGAADLALPIIREMPGSESVSARAASAAKSAIGGLLGGGSFGGGGPFGGGGGPRMVRKPKGPWDDLRSGDTGIALTGWTFVSRHKNRPPLIRIALEVRDSPFNGGPDSVWLQDANGNVLHPVGYLIFEIWRHWRLTITITREHYVNGQLVSRSVTRESTQWKELLDRYKVLLTAPSIWERLQTRPFDKLRGVIVEFPLPKGFDPSRWSLVAHVTSKAKMNGKEVIKTTPFAADVMPGKGRHLRFHSSEGGQTRYQREHHCPGGTAGAQTLVKRFTESVQDGMAHGETAAETGTKAPAERHMSKPSRRSPRKPDNRHRKVQKIRVNGANWARLVVLQRQPLAWLKRFHALQGDQQRLAAAFMANLALAMMTGMDMNALIEAAARKWHGRMSEVVSNLAIEAARRWQGGLLPEQQREISRLYEGLSPGLRQVFARSFVSTLAMNLFLDLRMPKPAAY